MVTTTVAFLEQLRQLGVRLSLTDDKLHIQAPKGALTPELRTQLQERGNEVATYLRDMRTGMEKLPPIVRSELISAELVDFHLSFNQQHIWHKHTVSHNPARFNRPTLIELSGPLNMDAFTAALNALVARHHTLRMVVVDGDSEARQRILPKLEMRITQVDLRDESDARRKAVLMQQVAHVIEAPFSLRTGPLLRVHLYQTADEQFTLLLVAHQLIFDARSLTVMLRDWSLFYEQIVAAAEFDLPPRPFAPSDDESVEYGDYVSWQRWPGMYDTQVAHWREQLGDITHGPPPVCKLPSDWARPNVQGDRGATASLLLSHELTAKLKSMAQEQGVTLRMLMLTAYKLLLSRLTGDDEVVVGSILPARTQVSLANVVGYFENTVVLRTDLRDDPTFVQLLRRVAQISLGAQSNQDVPFARMLEALRAEGNLSAASLVQAFFDMPVQPIRPFAVDSLESHFLPTPEPTVLYDMTLNVRDLSAGLSLEMVYRHELFSPKRVEGMLKQLEFILMQASVAGNRPIASFSLNPSPPKITPHYPSDFASVSAYVEQQARHRADKIAVCDSEFCLSYDELNSKANQVANYLHAKGINPGDRVAIVAARSTSLVPVMLGVIKSGAAFAMIDPSEPTRRLATRLAELQASAAIVLQEADPLPVMLDQCLSQIRLVFRYPIDESLPADSTRAPQVELRPDVPVYITFSRETRDQFPVEITQRSLAHLIEWTKQRFDLMPNDRFGLIAGLGSDTILRDVLIPLTMGASLYVPDRKTLVHNLGDWMLRKRITVCNLTPPQSDVLVRHLSGKDEKSPLRTIFFGDGHLSSEQVSRLREQLARIELVALYGTAESALVSGYQVIPAAGLLLKDDSIPLGQGIEGFDLLVLTEHGQLAGVGELGEIYVRSPYLAQGYLNRPKLTATHFVMSRRFGRLWRTRDFGRLRPDGLIEYVPA